MRGGRHPPNLHPLSPNCRSTPPPSPPPARRARAGDARQTAKNCQSNPHRDAVTTWAEGRHPIPFDPPPLVPTQHTCTCTETWKRMETPSDPCQVQPPVCGRPHGPHGNPAAARVQADGQGGPRPLNGATGARGSQPTPISTHPSGGGGLQRATSPKHPPSRLGPSHGGKQAPRHGAARTLVPTASIGRVSTWPMAPTPCGLTPHPVRPKRGRGGLVNLRRDLREFAASATIQGPALDQPPAGDLSPGPSP